MSFKLFIFDLDGVLVDFCTLHRDSFLTALNEIAPQLPVDIAFHDQFLEGRSTNSKLKILKEHFGEFDSSAVSDRKQAITKVLLETDEKLLERRVKKALEWIKLQGIKVACYSNSIRSTVEVCLKKLDIYDLMDCVKSNEDVPAPKPDPVGYIKVMQELKVSPFETLIFEDSHVGLSAAYSSGAHVMRLINSLDVTLEFLQYVHRQVELYVTQKNQIAFKSIVHGCNQDLRHLVTDSLVSEMNIVIPMAGTEMLLNNRGQKVLKPFLTLFGNPVFRLVIENVLPQRRIMFEKVKVHLLARPESVIEIKKFSLPQNLVVHEVTKPTEGAAVTILGIKEHINNKSPLFIVNCNQFLEWNVDDFFDCCFHPAYDGVISTFDNPHPKDLRWSYVKVDAEGKILQVAEKKYIGPDATTGLYFWKEGEKFVKYAEEMIASNDRFNNEFYVCPVYNYAIKDSLRFRSVRCTKFWSFSTQHDFQTFANQVK